MRKVKAEGWNMPDHEVTLFEAIHRSIKREELDNHKDVAYRTLYAFTHLLCELESKGILELKDINTIIDNRTIEEIDE